MDYAFLFRNYRPDLGKWPSQDPIGYPDGWNNFTYCGNRVLDSIDHLGAYVITSSIFYNMLLANNTNFLYEPTPNSYVMIAISGSVRFTIKREQGDAPNSEIRVASIFDKGTFSDTLNILFSPNEYGEKSITYNFQGSAYSYRADGTDSGMHWYRFGIAIKTTENNYTSVNLSSKQYFNLKEKKENEE